MEYLQRFWSSYQESIIEYISVSSGWIWSTHNYEAKVKGFLRGAIQANLAMRNLQKSLNHSLPFLCFLLLCPCGGPLVMTKELIPIGVLLDLTSPIGRMVDTCISMALHDFYTDHAHYKTRLLRRRRDSKNDVVKAAFAASDLIKNEKVHAIIGPQRSGQAKFIIELGSKSQVPIISFSATSPSLSPTGSRFFIRTAQDDCSQIKAIAAIVETYGWREIVLIYEDTEYGNGLIPYLNGALRRLTHECLTE
ncbi:hypothetical protein L6164_014105 [Bauhinia variegata]|uniref:Uncharacterized protein n=1 Tax=Bauhinia variegata TaxID=167791 RepID=A0ACB9NJZ8_BAUVA|nr:hypothetical protein L6164_014105 [Bauhinia variegata]